MKGIYPRRIAVRFLDNFGLFAPENRCAAGEFQFRPLPLVSRGLGVGLQGLGVCGGESHWSGASLCCLIQAQQAASISADTVRKCSWASRSISCLVSEFWRLRGNRGFLAGTFWGLLQRAYPPGATPRGLADCYSR